MSKSRVVRVVKMEPTGTLTVVTLADGQSFFMRKGKIMQPIERVSFPDDRTSPKTRKK